MGLMAGLDPRRHLAAAIGWTMLAVVTLASLVAASLAAAEAERVARADTERLLHQFATQVQQALAVNLRTRLAIVQATAAQIAASGDRGSDALRRHLDAMQAQFPEFGWVGVADADGRVVAATGGILQGESVAQQPWFHAARSGPVLGDVHEAQLLEGRLPRAADGQPLRFVDAAAPVVLPSGVLSGVVGGYLGWDWIDALQRGLLATLDVRRALDLLLANEDGVVIAGPRAWLGRTLTPDDDLSEAGRYIVGRHAAESRSPDQRWSVAIRQRAEAALAPAQAAARKVFLTVMLAGLASALVAVLAVRWLTRRLAWLSDQAVAVRRGERPDIGIPPGRDEVSRIGATLSDLVDHLQREKAALAQLNAELDARVAERTARIERLADETRHAAVTRERLRLARDLHDTLAHSLMALLTQLRLLRKLKDRLSAGEFDAELARAEEAAAGGLVEARAAIAQMRHGSVRESGLAAALRDLLARFGERTGVATTFHAQGWAADLADERAETLYRIVEEALRNVERHARASAVLVEIGDAAAAQCGSAPVAGPRAFLSVRDDGAGFDASAPSPGHFGMLGMHEQAELIGAELGVRSAPGQGTEVRLEFAQ